VHYLKVDGNNNCQFRILGGFLITIVKINEQILDIAINMQE
jgi:hypothetical protein